MGETAEIPLHNHKGEVRAYTLIDAEDFDWLSEYRWSITNTYAYSRRAGGYLHRVILGLKAGDPRQGDHKDRVRLNNQRSNLRIISGHAANQQNTGPQKNSTSGYRGVTWHKKRRKWYAHAQLAGRKITVGYFLTAEKANEAVCAWRAANMPFSSDAQCAK